MQWGAYNPSLEQGTKQENPQDWLATSLGLVALFQHDTESKRAHTQPAPLASM